MDTIKECRQHIDQIDQRLIELLNLRFAFCKIIGEEKKRNHIKKHDPNREQNIINSLSEKEEYAGMVEAIWPHIIDFSKTLQ